MHRLLYQGLKIRVVFRLHSGVALRTLQVLEHDAHGGPFILDDFLEATIVKNVAARRQLDARLIGQPTDVTKAVVIVSFVSGRVALITVFLQARNTLLVIVGADAQVTAG